MEPSQLKRRKPWLAALLSFVTTGLGQLYNGQWKKGAGLFVIETALGLGVVMAMGTFAGLITGILFLLSFNLFVAGEAYLSAKRTTEYRLGPCNRWWIYTLLIVANLTVGATVDQLASASFYKTFKVPSGSMLQTLQIGDHFMAEILTDETAIHRGDILVFKDPEKGVHFVKRAIGLPGELIEIQEKNVFINGKRVDEPYVQHTKMENLPIRDYFPAYKLKQDEYFLLGDNREKSYDSRWLGPIKKDALKARAKYFYFPGDVGNEGWFARLGAPIR